MKTEIDWTNVEDALPKIPEGMYGVSVLVACFDKTLEEISPGEGHYVTDAVYSSVYDREGNRNSWYENSSIEVDFMTTYYASGGDTSWGPMGDPVTHWAYIPKPPPLDSH